MPCLVDSVTAEINRHEAEVLLVIHPIISLRRDAKGKLVELAPSRATTQKAKPGPAAGFAGESVMQIQISEQPPGRLAEIAAGVATVLDDVRASVEDWPLMRERCREVLRSEEQKSAIQLLMRIPYAIFCLKIKISNKN